MTKEEVTTLAYSASPKASKRTTFQDELEAAVSARASKATTKRYPYLNESTDDDEDDFLTKLVELRKKKMQAFRTGRNEDLINRFDLSDDEAKPNKPKKVSFLKSQRKKSLSREETVTPTEAKNKASFSSTDENPDPSRHVSEVGSQFENKSSDSADRRITRGNSSPSYFNSDETMSLPLPSESSVTNTPVSDEVNKVRRENSSTSQVSSPHPNDLNPPDEVVATEPPVPKPRKRILGQTFQATEKQEEQNESQDLSGPQTSSASIPCSIATSSHITWTDRETIPSCDLMKSSSSKSKRSQNLTKSTLDSALSAGFVSDNSKEQERRYTSTFEEFDESTSPSERFSRAAVKSSGTRTSSSGVRSSPRSQSVCSNKVESRYLGKLKVLDHKFFTQESTPQAADSIRAVVYQDWLQKKKEKSRETMQKKKLEELVKERQKTNKETKKEDAIASFEAWKERKAESLREKAREQKEKLRKEQREKEEKLDKKQSAKKVFEKWKREHDNLLKEKQLKQKERENKLKQQKQEKEEERRRDSMSAFVDWCEKKKQVVNEKLSEERKEARNKEEEDRYLKEERDKMSLEVYENWLTRKDLEQKREKAERRIKELIQEHPPPPWSPPSNTIPYRK